MTFYLYKIGHPDAIITIEDVIDYSYDSVTTSKGVVYKPIADGWELSTKSDCSEKLRDKWKQSNISTESVLLELAADHEERLCMMELGI